MRQKLASFLTSDTLKARSARGTVLVVVGLGGQNVIRLLSNLILTRLLFPEVFGLMALVIVVQTGLAMLSDLGSADAVVQDRRSFDTRFLNTVWVMHIGRGILLWTATVVLAHPVATFYDAPMLAQILPVTGLAPLIQGFESTGLLTARRDLQFGRVTAIRLGAQVLGLLVTVGLAFWLRSVWALVLGSLVGPLTITLLSHLVLAGSRNRVEFDRAAAIGLFHFGKYIFIATVAGLVLGQADRAVLGKFVSLDTLAVYNIGFLFASVPLLLVQAVSTQVIFPLYARRPPAESASNRRKINQARHLVTGGGVLASAVLALAGNWLVVTLYDPRYHAAGPMLVLITLGMLPQIITFSYHRLPTAAGHSGRFAIITAALAALEIVALFFGVQFFGIGGVALATGIATLAFYPLLLALIRRYDGWDPVHDAVYFALATGIALLAVWLAGEPLLRLFARF